jgi:hypothetical protein
VASGLVAAGGVADVPRGRWDMVGYGGKSDDETGGKSSPLYPVIGLRENLQETMVFTIKYGGFL